MKVAVQDGGVIIALSRWRWTIVVVRQFSFVAISSNHPPAGIRSGVVLTALRTLSCTGRTVWPDFFTMVWLLSVVITCSPGSFLQNPLRGADIYRGGSILPPVPVLPERRALRGKRSGGSSFRSWSVNGGTSAGLSRVLPQDLHSDQEICPGSTYNRKMCRVPGSYPAVLRLNMDDGKDINTDPVFVREKPVKNTCRSGMRKQTS